MVSTQICIKSIFGCLLKKWALPHRTRVDYSPYELGCICSSNYVGTLYIHCGFVSYDDTTKDRTVLNFMYYEIFNFSNILCIILYGDIRSREEVYTTNH